ncbi:glucose-1-phosphate cytidylyltransferase [Papillibacter cinnamivorans]|uniref:Glucose-1-phosphate cytidylyltransferase n=1 Tax=Papillibacter cinnamivorans DSM 12816 TaxID=1122930 RepID=A0A1W2CEJ4_9FIRM|nr:glucose-1-phosphate cytidylyltransferase [Papillibacter cinnamivorans]SMC83302.1 glucose-1-phosphate cytidylyltransferase [Papillibacter cinnamivorans DSM 12816]
MKVVILAGGFGTRFSGESPDCPKPMVRIGGMPLIWHIMKYYACYGHTEFILCAGYKQQAVKDFFFRYCLHRSDVTFDFTSEDKVTYHSRISEPWRVTVADTGRDTMTGGRVARVRPYVGEETFLLTYGDGLSDLDVNDTIRFHREHGKMLTVTAVQPEERFGVLSLDESGSVTAFHEKEHSGRWINAGFMVAEPEWFNYMEGDGTVLEKEPMERAAREGKIRAYRHTGFWQCMDTPREKRILEELWESGKAPWKLW